MIDQTWADEAIKHCLALGFDHFFLAPGYRCTPLTLAVAREKSAQVVQHFDERGLAFAALGYGRAAGKPGVFICTSGTAVANAFPAVIEAAMESIPMLLFTADRPEELRGTGANQTIEQRRIFGEYPSYFGEVSVPHGGAHHERLTSELTSAFRSARHGPVHLNWQFRQPFTVSDVGTDSDVDESSAVSDQDTKPPAAVELRGNVLIALGGCRPAEARLAIELSKKLDCPMLSDITSGLRSGPFDLPSEFALPQPDTILHFGGRIVSKAWWNWIAELNDAPIGFVHLTSTGQTINPHHHDVKKYCGALDELVPRITGGSTSDEFRAAWQSASNHRRQALTHCLGDEKNLSEPAIAYRLAELTPVDHAWFVGNSTPIRDMDWFCPGENEQIRIVGANRGASGIDGLMATAAGFAIGHERPTTVLLGDLSALHDLNSLALVAKSPVPMVVLIVNNQSGHIFDLLPISESTQHFEKFFATPHEFGFESAAEMFGLDYTRVTEMPAFVSAYQGALAERKTVVIELVTDRQYNMEVRRRVRAEIQRCSSQD